MASPNFFLKPKFTVVIFGAWFFTAVFAAILDFVLVLLHLSFDSWVVSLVFFLLTVTVMAVSVYQLATRWLYPRNEVADFVIYGGIRIGKRGEASLTGKKATWPFAKLLATKDELWIRAPWGDVRWPKSELTSLRRRGFCGTWQVTEFDSREGGPITFFAFPWHTQKVRKRLRSLGYKLG